MKAKLLVVQVLVFCAIHMSAQIGELPFVESFEFGIEKWTDETNTGTAEVTPLQSIVGTKSFFMTGTSTSDRLTKTFANSMQVNLIMYYVRVGSGDGGVVTVGDGINSLFHASVNGGNFVVHDVNGAFAITPVTNNEWVKVEVRNINYTENSFEVVVNDTILFAGLEFSSAINGVTKIDIYNTSATNEAWWDAIYLGMTDYEQPTYSGEKICIGNAANILFSEDVSIDSLGINLYKSDYTTNILNADSFLYYRHPVFESTVNHNIQNTLSWSGNMFNITALDKDLVVYAIDVIDNEVVGPDAVKVYYRKGTYVGHHMSPDGWLLHDSVAVILNGGGRTSFVEFERGMVIPKGQTYGIYVCVGKGVKYTNITATEEIQGEHMRLTAGRGGPYFGLSVDYRLWNGRIYYNLVEEQADKNEISTVFTSNNYFAGNMFDVSVKNDIIIDSLDVNILSDGWVKFYYRIGTCVGNNTSNAGWALLDSVQVIAAGQDNPTRVALKNKLLIPANTLYGIYVCTEGSMRYTNIITGVNDTYEDDNLLLTAYYGGANNFSVNSSRVWNGTLYYTVRNNEMAEVGPQTAGTFMGNVRGYCFEAPKDFIIKGVMVPDDVPGNQCVEILRFSEDLPPLWTQLTNNFTSLGYWKNVPQGVVIPCDIYVRKGDFIGVYGKGGSVTSYSNTVDPIDILGMTADIYRSGMQYDLLNEQMRDVWREGSGASDKGRVNLYIEDVSTSGGLDSLLIEVQTPVVNLGSDTTICDDQSIVLDAGSFSNYTWSTGGVAQFETVDSAGIGIDSVDVWVIVQDLYGCEASDTIRIHFVSCAGIDENIILLTVYPNPSSDIFFINAQGLNEEMEVEVMTIEGRVVSRILSSTQLTAIDLSKENPGIYMLRLRIGQQVQTVKLIVQ